MTCVDKLLKFFRRENSDKDSQNNGGNEEKEVEPVRKDAEFIQNTLPNDVKILSLDRRYWLYPREFFKKWIEENKIDEKNYRADRFDCENFAFSFKAATDKKLESNQVGLVIDYRAKHGYNVIVWPDESFDLFEPQNDKFVTAETSKKYNFNEKTFVLI